MEKRGGGKKENGRWHFSQVQNNGGYYEGKKMFLTRTSRAVVLPYPELVEVSGIPDGELVVIGKDRLLSVLHVNSQLVAALGSDPLDVVET